MKDNLPEINFKEKKEKKGGLLGWLRGRLGLGARGAMGEGGISPSAMNVGRALGTAKFGASAGLGSFLAGNLGTIAVVAAMAVGGGIYLANNAPAPTTGTGAFSSNRSPDNYVPAILRSQAANKGSSLDMFKETNKGAGMDMDGELAKAAAEKAAAEKAAAAKAAAEKEEAANKTAEEPPAKDPGQQGMPGMMGKQGGSMGSLTSSLGGGSSKFSGMGGFGNKFNQGSVGASKGFSSGVGAGFSGMPGFEQRKGKMLAMKSAARPVFSGSKGGKYVSKGVKSGNQLKAMRSTQQSYTGNAADPMRSTQDAAWTGTTADGSAGAGGGAGLGAGSGGGGVVTSPSIDSGSSGGGGGGAGNPTIADPVVPEATAPQNTSPWTGMLHSIVTMLLASAMLAAAGSALIQASNAGAAVLGVGKAVLYAAGMALCIAAVALAAATIVMSLMLISKYGQAGLGAIYAIGGVCAMSCAFMGMAGSFNMVANFSPMWMAAAAGAIALMGSMMGK